VLFSPATVELIAPLQATGLADRLLLSNGAPYPSLIDVAHEKFAGFAEKL